MEIRLYAEDDVKDDVNEILNKIFPLIKSHRIEWLKGILDKIKIISSNGEFGNLTKEQIFWLGQTNVLARLNQILKNAEKEEKL